MVYQKNQPRPKLYLSFNVMLFDSVGGAEDRRSIWGQGKGATKRRPSRFPNEIAKTAPNLPRILHEFLFNKACRKAVRYYRWFVFVLFRVIYSAII